MQKTCLIIPCYNEAKRLSVEAIQKFINENDHVSFFFVNDGSKDATLPILESMQKKNVEKIFILSLKINKGKAEAIRQAVLDAMNWSRFEVIGFWDADISTPLAELNKMLRIMRDEPTNEIIIASRVKRLGAIIERKRIRHIFGRIFSTFSSLILKLPVYDSQCGAKIFNTTILSIAFSDPFISKWLFDVEILARIRNKYGTENAKQIVYEMPVSHWADVSGSKIRFTHYLKVPFELLKINNHYNK
ncbi:MAG: glycosyltransferase [Bacteroidetes bacterium]|nr:glycosyltransferase [Bacteroidota bacterium]